MYLTSLDMPMVLVSPTGEFMVAKQKTTESVMLKNRTIETKFGKKIQFLLAFCTFFINSAVRASMI